MAIDLWRQWQAFAAMAVPGGIPPQAGLPAGALCFAPFIEAAERFAAAARSFLEGTAHASPETAAESARTFSEFLREQFAGLCQVPFKADVLAAVGMPFSADAPALGLTREHQQCWQRTAEAWRRMTMRSVGCSCSGPMRCEKAPSHSRRGSCRPVRPRRP